jgi:hypothetical protein
MCQVTYCSSVVGSIEQESIRMLTKTVKAGLIRETCPQAEVLVFKYETCCRSIEEGFIIAPASDGKREGIVGPGEC